MRISKWTTAYALAVLAFMGAADAQTAPPAPDSIEGHLAAGGCWAAVGQRTSVGRNHTVANSVFIKVVRWTVPAAIQAAQEGGRK